MTTAVVVYFSAYYANSALDAFFGFQLRARFSGSSSMRSSSS